MIVVALAWNEIKTTYNRNSSIFHTEKSQVNISLQTMADTCCSNTISAVLINFVESHLNVNNRSLILKKD